MSMAPAFNLKDCRISRTLWFECVLDHLGKPSFEKLPVERPTLSEFRFLFFVAVRFPTPDQRFIVDFLTAACWNESP